MIKINICADFSDAPGGRLVNEGDFSGEEFRLEILEPKFKDAISNNDQLEVNLDGGYGYPTSFLEEAFGGLARDHGRNCVLERIKLISDDEPSLVDEIISYIENADLKKCR